MKAWDVIVIGGGLAGLIAARELSTAGLSVVVLEGRDRLGGRTESRAFKNTDVLIELGGTYFDECQPIINRELQRYGLKKEMAPEPHRFIWQLAGMRWEGGFPIPWEEAVAAERALAALRAASERVQLGVPHDLQEISDLDVSISEYIDRLEVGPVTRDFLYSWASLYTGTDQHTGTALYHLHSIAALGNSPVALAPALYIVSGTGSLVGALASDGSAEIKLSTPVRIITQDEHGVTVTSDRGEEFRAERAVVAVPLNTLADITFEPALNDKRMAFSSEQHAARGYKVLMLVENLSTELQAVGWSESNGFTWFSTTVQDEGRSVLVGFGYPRPDFDPFDLETVSAALRELVPEARVIAIDWHDWNTDPFSRGTWMVPRPGQLTRLMSGQSVREGRLYFAGADMSLQWLSWMEGALETGIHAAEQLIADRLIGSISQEQ